MTRTVEVTIRGPVVWNLSEAQMAREVEGLAEDAAMEVARPVLATWQDLMHRAFRNPRPLYWTTVTIQQRRAGTVAVTDHAKLPYGPWLEGEGRRNKTTRFKGYHSARRAMSTISGNAVRRAQPAVDRGLDRLR